MSKLRLEAVLDDKPVKITIELPAAVHRDLLAYADALKRQTGQAVDAAKLIAPMLGRFMAGDRAFTRARKSARAVTRQSSSDGNVGGDSR